LTVSEYSDCSEIQLERINGGWKSPESYQYKTIYYYVQYIIMIIRVLYITHIILYSTASDIHNIVLYYMYIAAVDLRRAPKSLLSSPDPDTGRVRIFSIYLGTIILKTHVTRWFYGASEFYNIFVIIYGHTCSLKYFLFHKGFIETLTFRNVE